MKEFGLLITCVLAAASSLAAQTMPELRSELLQMVDRDQKARDACGAGTTDDQMKCFMRAGEEVDRPNTKRINEIFAQLGFPTVVLVGSDGVKAFILLMQHSGDIPLRKKSQAGMKKAFNARVISVSEYTTLIDRLLVHQGKPQIYGSNFEMKDGRLVMSPAKDLKKLDKRRKKIGLPPIADYVKMLKDAYNFEVVAPTP
ncbi:MAG: hypothetical protein JO053_13325 [Acidobacteria bacterium]|nr:hypothetical protein [Acidobacteriota bacterium]